MNARRKIVFHVRCFRLVVTKGSKGGLFSIARTNPRHWAEVIIYGMPLEYENFKKSLQHGI